jgi:hypothetical protein
MSDVVHLSITNCVDCPKHSVRPDPDPNDWFCDDDVKVVCTASQNKEITVACRPYNTRKECTIPKWCPLRKQEKKTACPKCGSEKVDPCGRGGLRCCSCNNRWGAD